MVIEEVCPIADDLLGAIDENGGDVTLHAFGVLLMENADQALHILAQNLLTIADAAMAAEEEMAKKEVKP